MLSISKIDSFARRNQRAIGARTKCVSVIIGKRCVCVYSIILYSVSISRALKMRPNLRAAPRGSEIFVAANFRVCCSTIGPTRFLVDTQMSQILVTTFGNIHKTDYIKIILLFIRIL